MRHIRSALARIAGIFTRFHRDDDLRDELQSHLDMETDENIRRGMHPDEARRLARVAGRRRAGDDVVLANDAETPAMRTQSPTPRAVVDLRRLSSAPCSLQDGRRGVRPASQRRRIRRA